MTCGVCLREDVDVINIFGEEGTELQISAIIKQHFWFEPIEGDQILSRICSSCWEQIANFHVFYTNVKNAHKKLTERYYANDQYTGDVYDQYQQGESSSGYQGCSYGYVDASEALLEETKTKENDNSYYNEDHTNDEEGSNLFVASNKNSINVYDENYEDQDVNVYEGVEEDDDCLLEQATFKPAEDFDENTNPYNYEKQIKRNSTKSKKNQHETTSEIQIIDRDSLSYKKDPRNQLKIRDEARVKLEDQVIAKYVKLQCEECQSKFNRFHDLVKHYNNAHKMSGFVRCCNKKLPSRAYVLDHINKHRNPESYRCKICHKMFGTQYAIKNHVAIKHPPEAEKIYTCEFCPEKFTNQHALNQHASHHISEEERRTYCIECRKSFQTVIALQMHKNVYHGQLQGHICHVCGKIIRGKSVFAKHVNEHAAELGPVAINDPVCPICGKLSASIKTLRHHIRYVHSSHRPHKCEVCGKAFKIRQKLKEHMGSHAVGNPFPCPYCPKRFRSKLHLYSHKYRMHKDDYEEEKLVRFNLTTETFSSSMEYNYEHMDENETQQYDDSSIVLKYVELFETQGVALEIASIISKHFWFEPKINDPISTIICNTCWQKLDNFHVFYTTVEDAHRKFSEYICIKEEPDIKKEDSDIVKLENSVVDEEMHFIIKSEPDYFDNEGNEGNQQDSIEPVYMECTKYEEELYIEEPSKYEITEKDHEHASAAKEETTTSLLEELPDQKTDTEDSNVEKESPNVQRRRKAKERSLLKRKCIKRDESEISDDSSPEDTSRQSKLKERNKSLEYLKKSKEDDEIIAKHIKLKCEICGVEFSAFAEVREHYRTVHKRKGYVVCCNKKLPNRVIILDHINKHLNPDYFKCKECNKVFSDKQCLVKHMLRHESEEAKIYKCEKCPRKYAKQYLLDQHKLIHIPQDERKFSCDECGKAFPTNTLLISHRRYVHENAYGQECHICAKVIIGKAMFKKHQLEHAGVVEPKVQCQKCGAWLKHAYSLRKHMRLHIEKLSTHTCNICGKTASSKATLRSHIRYVHALERSHQCSVCDKAFKRPIQLKEHMTTHTGEVLYTCPHCPKTFRKSANMHTHRKKMHRKEWEETRRSRGLPPSDSKLVDSETD